MPDAPSYVKYNAPLYKADRRTRGRVAYERGPGRQYKFITSGPDQRRSESTGPDGITRGSYSYLDDKGIQRTIQYIAGPGIGYRVVQSTTGPGTHLLPRPAVPEFNIPYPQSNDIVDNEGSGFKTSSSSPPFGGNQNNRISTNDDDSVGGGGGGGDDNVIRNRDHLLSNAIDVLDPTNNGNILGGNRDDDDNVGPGYNDDDNISDDFSSRPSRPGGASLDTGFRPTVRPNFDASGFGGTSSHNNNDGFDVNIHNDKPTSFVNSNRNKYDRNKVNRDRNESPRGDSHGYRGGGSGHRFDDSDIRNRIGSNGPNSTLNEWRKRARHSTIGSWYVGLPGVAVRAHVQNIDLIPAGHGVESPGQAAKREDQARYLKIF